MGSVIPGTLVRNKPNANRNPNITKLRQASARQISPLVRRVSAFEHFLKKHFPIVEPSRMPATLPIGGVLRGSVGRRLAGSLVRGRMTKIATCAECPLARIRLGGGGTGSMRRRWRAVGCLKLRDIRMSGISGRLGWGLFGSFFATMSASRLRDTGKVLRQSRIGRSFRGTVLGGGAAMAAQDFVW